MISMIAYELKNEYEGLDSRLRIRKLADVNANIGQECLMCGNKKIKDLYFVEYERDQTFTVQYGTHCLECAKKIFKIKDKSVIFCTEDRMAWRAKNCDICKKTRNNCPYINDPIYSAEPCDSLDPKEEIGNENE